MSGAPVKFQPRQSIEQVEEGDAARVTKIEGGGWEDSLWYAMQKCDVAWFGIKPFSSGNLFKGDSSPASPHFEADNRLARMAIRYILCNPAITAPIPGLISTQQVDNIALAVKQRRVLDLREQAELNRAMQRAWANLPPDYQWLKDWEYV